MKTKSIKSILQEQETRFSKANKRQYMWDILLSATILLFLIYMIATLKHDYDWDILSFSGILWLGITGAVAVNFLKSIRGYMNCK